jgi:hypothetical protein
MWLTLDNIAPHAFFRMVSCSRRSSKQLNRPGFSGDSVVPYGLIAKRRIFGRESMRNLRYGNLPGRLYYFESTQSNGTARSSRSFAYRTVAHRNRSVSPTRACNDFSTPDSKELFTVAELSVTEVVRVIDQQGGV